MSFALSLGSCVSFRIKSRRSGLFAPRFGLARIQTALQICHRLFQPLFVFDQGDADESFAAFAEGPARGQRHFGFVHHPQAEVDRPSPLRCSGLIFAQTNMLALGFS